MSTDGPATTPDGARDGLAVSARDVTKRYGEGDAAVDALRGVTVDFPKGQFAAVMGPSGSGKSTLMNILAGLDAPTSGSVVIDGTEITTLKDKQLTLLRREKVGLRVPVLQPPADADGRGEPGAAHDDRGPQDRPRVGALLVSAVGLSDRRRHRPSELSGGQQQRVALARGLISRPAVLFADEPTGNLDSSTSEEMLKLLRRSVDEYGQTIVMVTHDGRAAATADRVVFLLDGEIVEDHGHLEADEVYDVVKGLEQA